MRRGIAFNGKCLEDRAGIRARMARRDTPKINEPVDWERVSICVLCGAKDLTQLAFLIPNVRELVLEFCEPELKRDLSQLSSLFKENGGHLESLKVQAYFEDKGVRLKNNVAALAAKIGQFFIDGKPANQFKQKALKNPAFSHFTIQNLGGIIIYYVNSSELDKRIIEKVFKIDPEYDWIKNIVVQFIPERNEYLGIISYDDHGTSQSPAEMRCESMAQQDAELILLQHIDRNSNIAIPKTAEDLLIEDNDDLDNLAAKKQSSRFDDFYE